MDVPHSTAPGKTMSHACAEFGAGLFTLTFSFDSYAMQVLDLRLSCQWQRQTCFLHFSYCATEGCMLLPSRCDP
jgi:hypothetical protein